MMAKTKYQYLSTLAAILLRLPLHVLGQGTPPPGGDGGGGSTVVNLPQVVLDEIVRCGSPFDAHLHLEAQWFSPDNAQPLLAEMSSSGIDQGILMAVYGPVDALGVDPNEGVANFVQQSNGRLFGLASLNTTAPNWETVKYEELGRMKTFLESDGFVGVKVAPPHTRMPLNSSIMGDILQEISESSKPVLAVHIGTTPFCGPFGDLILGKRGNCTQEYVDPNYLEDFISMYANVTFVIMHGGQDFDDGASGDVPYYGGELFDHTLELMSKYDNMVLEISAMLATNAPPDDSYRNPLAFENLLKVVSAGMQDRTLYGSDSNQFPGGLTAYLISTISSLIAAGFTEQERCSILVEFAKEVYSIPEMTNAIPSAAPGGTATPTMSMSTDTDPQTAAPTASPTSSAKKNFLSKDVLLATAVFMTAFASV